MAKKVKKVVKKKVTKKKATPAVRHKTPKPKASKPEPKKKVTVKKKGKRKLHKGMMPPWVKGQSGNPKGRPPGRYVSQHLKLIANTCAADMPMVATMMKDRGLDPKKYTVGEYLGFMMVEKALESNDPKRVEQVMERLEGKAVQQIKQEIDIANKGYSKVSPDDWEDEEEDA